MNRSDHRILDVIRTPFATRALTTLSSPARYTFCHARTPAHTHKSDDRALLHSRTGFTRAHFAARGIFTHISQTRTPRADGSPLCAFCLGYRCRTTRLWFAYARSRGSTLIPRSPHTAHAVYRLCALFIVHTHTRTRTRCVASLKFIRLPHCVAYRRAHCLYTLPHTHLHARLLYTLARPSLHARAHLQHITHCHYHAHHLFASASLAWNSHIRLPPPHLARRGCIFCGSHLPRASICARMCLHARSAMDHTADALPRRHAHGSASRMPPQLRASRLSGSCDTAALRCQDSCRKLCAAFSGSFCAIFCTHRTLHAPPSVRTLRTHTHSPRTPKHCRTLRIIAVHAHHAHARAASSLPRALRLPATHLHHAGIACFVLHSSISLDLFCVLSEDRSLIVGPGSNTYTRWTTIFSSPGGPLSCPHAAVPLMPRSPTRRILPALHTHKFAAHHLRTTHCLRCILALF